jgi:hypothetical protein
MTNVIDPQRVQRSRPDDKSPWGSPERVVGAVVLIVMFSLLHAANILCLVSRKISAGLPRALRAARPPA